MSLAGELPSREVPQQRADRWAVAVHRTIDAKSEQLAGRIMALHFERNPRLEESYGPRQRAYYLQDTVYNLESLAAAILLETPQIFADYVTWLVEMLEARKIPTSGLGLHFECVRDALHEVLPSEVHTEVDSYIRAGVEQLGTIP